MKNLKEIILFGGAYAAVFVGVGVASGQEIMQYFTNHGMISFVAIVLFLIISTAECATVMGLARIEPKAVTYDYYFGKYIGGALTKVIMPIICFLVAGTLLSGAGSIAQNYFGIPAWAGVGFMTLCLFVSYLFDSQKIADILGLIGPVLVVITVIVCLIAISRGDGVQAGSESAAANTEAYVISKHWWWGAIQYAAFVPGMALLFIGEMGKNTSSFGVAIKGAVAGNILLVISFVAMNWAFLSNYGAIANSDVPTVELVRTISPVLGTVYGIVIFAALYSTVLPSYWIVCNAMPTKRINKKADIGFALILSVLYLLCGKIPFGTALNFVYPIVGYITTIVLIAVIIGMIRFLIKRKKERVLTEK